VVAAVHYFATAQDQESLLDYLGEPESVTLRPWPAFDPSQAALSRRQALASVHVTVVPAALPDEGTGGMTEWSYPCAARSDEYVR